LRQAQHELVPPELHSKQPEMQDDTASSSACLAACLVLCLRRRATSPLAHDIATPQCVQREAVKAALDMMDVAFGGLGDAVGQRLRLIRLRGCRVRFLLFDLLQAAKPPSSYVYS
jgi:hypothetical protein